MDPRITVRLLNPRIRLTDAEKYRRETKLSNQLRNEKKFKEARARRGSTGYTKGQ